MKSERNARGFVVVRHLGLNTGKGNAALIQESSAIADYDHSFDTPGSSYLWIGDNHHLDREEVAELVERMQHWLDNGNLAVDGE